MNLKEKIKNGAVVVDVRTKEEFDEEHFPGAINIPVDRILVRKNELPKDKSLILYCASGARSAYAAHLLKAEGYKDVVNAGGLDDMMELA